MDSWLFNGDCLEELKFLSKNSVHALITDPPAGISFMGKDWDGNKGGRKEWCAWMESVMRECFRVMKPGAHGLVWALPRTSHWTATALEDAGFEIRDIVTHLFGSGFPKSHNISKAIDTACGAERKVIGTKITKDIRRNVAADILSGKTDRQGKFAPGSPSKTMEYNITAPSTDAAKQWNGWGTALKPASEHWILIRRPCSEKTVASNVLKHGVGGLNIDVSRVEAQDHPGVHHAGSSASGSLNWNSGEKKDSSKDYYIPAGRFPANLILSHSDHCTENQCDIECPVKLLNSQVQSDVARFFYVCGQKNIKADGMSVGKKKENKGDNLSIDGYGSSLMDQYQMGTTSITEMGTHLIISFPIFSASTKTLTGTCTIETDKTIKPLMALNIVAVSVASATNVLIYFQDGQQELITGTVSLALGSTCRNGERKTEPTGTNIIGNIGHPSRAFYCAKASKADKNAGLDKPSANHHPTVKSTKLMQYLIKLITPPGGMVLDPFMGSGSTGVAAKALGFDFIGIERESEYFEIAKKRIRR